MRRPPVWFVHQLKDISISVTKKRMRTMRLRVRTDGTVACSVPLFTTKRVAVDFIENRADWITKAVAAVQTQAKNKQTLRKDSAAAQAGLTDADRENGYSAAWKKAAMDNFAQTAEKLLPCFAKSPIPQFSPARLKGRAMKTLWGSCNRRTNVVTLNWALFAAPQECIDYVVLHELTHFLHLHHDTPFYAFIAQWMPDYKARIKMLRSLRLSN